MQISLFDGANKFIIDKPIRLIELFAGYGSQHFALKYLGVECESYKICEWAVKSIQAYKDAHFKDDNTDYSKDLTKEQIFEYLTNKGISSNYNEPMTYEQIKRLGEERIRQIYNNIAATCNLVNIQQVRGKDLDIIDYDKYCYIMTYSFPCQDLSNAGLGKGMEKGSGTRSGMLWEIERILDECENKPQVLLMENVPEVIGTNNIKHFAQWLEKLESLGYKCYWQVLNAKDYGVPQNRERCFMVSILGDYYYEFPEKQELKVRLKDLLEENVDEKFYLSDKALKGTMNTEFSCSKLENRLPKDGIVPTICARDYKDPKCIIISKTDDDYIEMKGKKYPITINNENYIQWKQKGFLESDCRAWKINKITGTLTTNGKLKILDDVIIRKLTPKECFRLMGVKDQDFERVAQNQSNASLYHLAGDSIVINVLMEIFKEILC